MLAVIPVSDLFPICLCVSLSVLHNIHTSLSLSLSLYIIIDLLAV